MPPKTLHLTNAWHETSGGIATFYRELMAEANRRRQPIRLVVPGAEDRIEEAGEFARIYHLKAPHALLNHAYRMIYPSQFLWAGGKLQQILLAERPDVVEICDKYSLNYLGAVLRRQLLPAIDFRPVVVGLSCERMDDNFKTYLGSVPFSRQFCSVYMRWLYFPFFDHHIANSEYTAGELRSAAERQSSLRCVWIRPMGVDLSHLSPKRRSPELRLRLLQNLGATETSVLLLYAGRLAPEKNLALLFQTLQRLCQQGGQDFRLLIVGDGIERNRWEADCAQRLPGRVMFLGHIKDRDVLADLYANADVFVHPNPREPFGIAPLEAMASGLPLVAPDEGGVTSYANAENAWVVPAHSQNFAAAVEAVAASAGVSNADRQTKIATALATAEKFRWEAVAGSFLDLYDKLHRAATGDVALPAPAFGSTTATGIRAALFRGVSRGAENTFSVIARVMRKPSNVSFASPHCSTGQAP